MASQLSHPVRRRCILCKPTPCWRLPILMNSALPRGALVFPLSGEGKGSGLSCGCSRCVVACRMQATSQFTTTTTTSGPPAQRLNPSILRGFVREGCQCPDVCVPFAAPGLAKNTTGFDSKLS